MVEFVRRGQAAARAVAGVAGSGSQVWGALGQFRRSVNIWFWAIVGLPTLIAGVYFFAIASDLYLSEVKFMLRGPAKSSTSTLNALLSGSSTTEDTFAVHEFLMSRDAVRKLEQTNDLRALLSRPEGDLITRFPGVVYWRRD